MKMDPSILSHQESTDLIAEEIGRQIYILMLRPVDSLDVTTTLNELGMDSLAMIEMRGWIKRNLEIEVTTLELLNCGTIKGVSALVLERLREELGASVEQ
jgi:acyl carrier protein